MNKHDINEAKETQELVKGIGDIAEKAMQIYTHSEREKIEQAKLELGKAQSQKASEEEIGKLQAKLDSLQRDYDKAYGTGSSTKRAVDAVTAALQGLAAKDAGQAVVGLASPYLNEQIKKHTDGNTEANLIAHALLGAVEAAATGNNALAGAAAGVSSEAAAKFITETLYQGKTTDQLTEAEKQNVVFLSQLAGGLAAGLIGDSMQSVAIGADVGKRAVENNFLSQLEYAELKRLMNKKVLTQEDSMRVQYLLEKDKVSSRLLYIWKTKPETLSQEEQALLFKWVDEYGNIPQQMQLLNASANASEMKPDYSDLKLRAQKVYNYSGSFEGRMRESLATGLSMVGTGGNGLVIKGGQYVRNATKGISTAAQVTANRIRLSATKYPNTVGMLADGTVSLGAHMGYKASTGQEIDPYEALGAFGSGALTRNQSLGNQIRINLGIATVISLSKDPKGNDLGNAYWGAITSPLINMPFNAFSSNASKALSGYASEYTGDLENRSKEIRNTLERINNSKENKK